MNQPLLLQELEQGHIVVAAGFQGRDFEGNVTTLGRGGSDTSAVALAAALGLWPERCVSAATLACTMWVLS